METIVSAERVILGMLLQVGAAVMAVIRVLEDFLRARLTDIGIQDTLQTVVIVVPAVLLLLLMFRLFTPVLRVFLIVFLLVVGLQFLDLNLQPRAELRNPVSAVG